MSIDVGLAAINRGICWLGGGWTQISKNNPVNENGTVKRIDIYAFQIPMTGVTVASFYSTGTNKFSTRDTEYIGDLPIGLSKKPVNLTVQAGDYIGIYFTAGKLSAEDGTIGRWFKEGDYIPCTNTEFVLTTTYDDFSLYGAYILATVTTQAVSSIGSVTATGNGKITNLNGENCSKRGVCYNTTGSPTVADSKVEAEGDFGTGAFTSAMTGLSPGVKYYVKAYAYNSSGYGYGAEVNFTTDKVAPTVTTQDPTNVLTTSVTGNGNITASGGENSTVRGFKYGLTQDDTWDAHDPTVPNGDFGAGAFTKAITEHLVANTLYWVRAYATNSIGTSYGAWVQFQTAASGDVPTGTKVSICSDYKGHTYKLNESLTDDGNTYESYFIISTDLADKQGLHFKKRLLDLFSYFENKASGTCKIYIKQDNETTWQYAGQISMVGDEDIIVKHLPSENQDSSGDVDFLAKHYLVKFVFSNDFDFIGCIFESVLIGVR